MTRPRLVATQTAAERLDARQQATIAALTDQLETAHSQLARVERTLAALLRSETTTETQRAELAGLLAGTRAIVGKAGPAPNTPAEQRLVDHYRALSSPSRQILSGVLRDYAELERFRVKDGLTAKDP